MKKRRKFDDANALGALGHTAHPKDFLYWKPCSRATRQQLTANNQL